MLSISSTLVLVHTDRIRADASTLARLVEVNSSWLVFALKRNVGRAFPPRLTRSGCTPCAGDRNLGTIRVYPSSGLATKKKKKTRKRAVCWLWELRRGSRSTPCNTGRRIAGRVARLRGRPQFGAGVPPGPAPSRTAACPPPAIPRTTRSTIHQERKTSKLVLMKILSSSVRACAPTPCPTPNPPSLPCPSSLASRGPEGGWVGGLAGVAVTG